MIKPYYDEGGQTIYRGDCLEILPELGEVDLVLTDPPYGIGQDRGFHGSSAFNGRGVQITRRSYLDKWDKARPSFSVFEAILKKSELALIFGGNYFADILPLSTHWIVWDKLNTMPTFGDCELIWTNSNRKSVKKYICEYNGLIGKEAERFHPTQKPVKLLTALLSDYSTGGQLILDPYLGSGSTLVACQERGRRGIGIEISEAYCEIAVKRLRQQILPGIHK